MSGRILSNSTKSTYRTAARARMGSLRLLRFTQCHYEHWRRLVGCSMMLAKSDRPN